MNDPTATIDLSDDLLKPAGHVVKQMNPFPEHLWQKIGSHFPEQSDILFHADIVAPFKITLSTAQDNQMLIRYLNQRRTDDVRDMRFYGRRFAAKEIPLIKRLIHSLLHCPIREGTPLHGALPSLLAQLFIWASEAGHTEDAVLLLKDPRVDPTAEANHAIRAASSSGRTEVVRLLLNDPRVDPSVRNNFAIRDASRWGHTKVVRLLLSDFRIDSRVKQIYA